MLPPVITPTQGDIEAWQVECETALKFETVRLGQFAWPQVILSLIGEWKRDHAAPEIEAQ